MLKLFYLIHSDEDRIYFFKKLQNMNLLKHSNEIFAQTPNIKINPIDYLMNGKYNYIMYNPKEYKYYMLSDLFNDECRSSCKFGKHKSPYNYFVENREKLLQSLAKK